jgi:hypothetical protein
MDDEETIDLYEAIRQMRKLSSEDASFSFVHSTLNRDTDTCNGIRHVRFAHLRPAAKGDDVVNADDKIFYFDEDLKEPRICWLILIMYFNGRKITLN